MPIALALALSGCSSKRAESTSCRSACEHLIVLAKDDIEKNIAKMGPSGDTIGASLRAQAAKSADSDLATCTAKCEEGKMNASCVLAAKSIDGAMTCSGDGGGGKQPVEPPSTRSDEDWPGAPVREISDEVGGIKFTIELPRELKEQEADRGPESRGWDFPGEPFSQPRFRMDVGPAFPKTVEAGVEYFAPSASVEILTKTLDDDRFTLVYKSKTYVVAKVLIRAGAKSLDCEGTHSSPGGLRNPEQLGAWFAKLCGQTKPR